MPRQDLLALTLGDLESLTNRGTVKRAARELESGAVKCELAETADGAVTVRWSDGLECHWPPSVVFGEGRCSCAAASVCRHLVLSVLAYQQQMQTAQPATEVAPASWDPGQIPDEQLAEQFSKAKLAAARARFEAGLLAELERGAKPVARFQEDQCTLRFLVPGDPRYTSCDCAEPAPCAHVPLAVWAFRRLEPTQASGLVSIRPLQLPVPAGLLDDLEAALGEGAACGLAHTPQSWKDRVLRLEARCRQAGLIWPADLVGELVQQFEAYHANDARFSPEASVELVGELLARSDAIRADTGVVPQVFVRGSGSDRITEIGAARFIGLGCGVHVRRRHVRITAFLQDTDTGTLAAVDREFADPPPDASETPKNFTQLAGATLTGRITLGALGAGQLLVKGAKRSANHRLLLPRAGTILNPQTFAWEQLREPILVADFAELSARLAELPPAALRPRRLTEDLCVVAVAGCEAYRFHDAEQSIEALVKDQRGQVARLEHPYLSRGQAGAEALLAALDTQAAALRFVSAKARLGPRGLVLHPLCLVFDEGSRRRALQPWLDEPPLAEGAAGARREAADTSPDPVLRLQRQLAEELGELWVLGVQRAAPATAQKWRDLRQYAQALGVSRLIQPLTALADGLERGHQQLDADTQPAVDAFLLLATLTRLGSDV